MRALVIGASGFAGRYMSEELLRTGYEVMGTCQKELPQEKESGILWRQLDLLSLQQLRDTLAWSQPDCVFNFATQSSVSQAWSDPGKTVEINVNGALNLFEAVRESGGSPMIVLVGAGEEYGRVSFSRSPIPEEENPHPANVYAASMACQTMMARIYHKAYGLRVVVARTFNSVGPGQDSCFAVSDFCRQAVGIERGLSPVIHVGNINIRRDYTDIRDLARAYRMLAEQGTPGEVYNVGSGRSVRIGDILELLNQRLGGTVRLSVERDRIRPIDLPNLVGDVSKLRRDTDWEPQITLEQTIEDMLQYWREQEN